MPPPIVKNVKLMRKLPTGVQTQVFYYVTQVFLHIHINTHYKHNNMYSKPSLLNIDIGGLDFSFIEGVTN